MNIEEKEENNQIIIVTKKNFIKDIFLYSNSLKKYIPKLKENSEIFIQKFILFIKESLDYNSLYFNLKLLKNIFMESNEIIELIQENKNYYSLDDKEFGIIGILIELYIKNNSFEINEILKEFFILFKKNEILYQKEVYFIFQKIGKEYYWEEAITQNYDNFIQYIILFIFLFTGKDYSIFNKRKSDITEKKLNSNNIYFFGGINIFLPLFEKLLLHSNLQKIFEKLLILIKELLINDIDNLIIAYNDKFFELLSVFIQNLDKAYFQNDDFFYFLFDINESLIKINKKKEYKYIEGFYDSIFFKYEIIMKMNYKMINKYFAYLNKYENLYKYMKFNICCKFLNEINIDTFRNTFSIFLTLIVKKLIKEKNENLNDIIYYLLKDDNNEKIRLVVLKTLKNELKIIKEADSNIDYQFMINLSFLISKNIEIKFLIIDIFQLLYFKYYNKLREIFIKKENPFKSLFYKIITNFFECNVIIDNKTKEQTTINNINKIFLKNSVYNDNKNLKKIIFDIIMKYILFSVFYMEPIFFNLDIPENFEFESYIKIISNNLEKLNKINNVTFYINENILNHLVDILVYSKIYIIESNKINKNNVNVDSKYLINIINFINNFIEKVVIQDIISDFDLKKKKYSNHLGFKIFTLFINKIDLKNKSTKDNIYINIIDELIGKIYFYFTAIENQKIKNLIDLRIEKHILSGFIEFFIVLKYFSEDVIKSLKKNKNQSYVKLSEIQTLFETLRGKNIFFDFLLKEYLNYNNLNEIKIKLEEMLKMFKIILMLFTQCFLINSNLNSENINFYIIFLYIIVDLGEYIINNDTLFNGNKEITNLLIHNLISLSFSNIQIILYLSLKRERNQIFEDILQDIINMALTYEKKNINYMNLIGDSKYTNLFYICLKKKIANFDNSIKISELLKVFINNSNNRKTSFLNDDIIDYKSKDYSLIWENNYIFPYNYLTETQNIKMKKKYIQIKKNLFSFNGIFSNKKLFYEDKSKLKYKNSNHLTENYSNPILKPILDWNKYISIKKEYENLFQNKIYNYINLSIFPKEESKKFIFDFILPKNYIKIPCCLIKITYLIKGFIFLKKNDNNELIHYFEFFGLRKQILDNNFKKNIFFSNIDLKINSPYYIKIKFKNLKLFFERKYYYLNNSIEIFKKKNKSYYFNFNNDDNKQIFLNIIKKNVDDNIQPKINNILEKWEKGKISTIKFLNLLNIYGNRSLKDITQYPIFPWIINDYSITNDKNNVQLRHLSLPIGQLNEKRKKVFDKKFNDMIKELDNKYKNYKIEDFIEDDNFNLEKIPYYYNNIYSNIDSVSYYLIRIFPFYFINFNSNKKVFYDLEKSYFNSLNSINNLREIIPQFFYFPEIFYNKNNLNLGISGNNVLLPKWSNNNPFIFVSIYREVLELIKDDIIDWINLIFGIYSRGENAKKKKNLFIPFSYDNIVEKKISKINIKEKENLFKLCEFGLVPFQLFKDQLTLKKERKITNQKNIIFQYHNLKKIKKVILNENKVYFFSNQLIYFSFDLEIQKITELNCNPFNIIKNIIFLPKENIIIFILENKIFKIKDDMCYSMMSDTILDKSEITVLYIDKKQENLFLGTYKGSLIIYKIKEIIDKIENHQPKWFIYHRKRINDIKVNNELNILIDCSDDGYINLYTLPEIKIFNSIYKENIVKYIFISSSPLFCFITYNTLKKFDCYNINCECINTTIIYKDINIKKENDIKSFELKYYTCSSEKFLEINVNEFDIYNSIVVSDQNCIDYLLTENRNFIEIRKFPFMLLVQTISFQTPYDKLFIIEDTYDIKFIKINFKNDEVCIQNFNKSQICESPLVILN